MYLKIWIAHTKSSHTFFRLAFPLFLSSSSGKGIVKRTFIFSPEQVRTGVQQHYHEVSEGVRLRTLWILREQKKLDRDSVRKASKNSYYISLKQFIRRGKSCVIDITAINCTTGDRETYGETVESTSCTCVSRSVVCLNLMRVRRWSSRIFSMRAYAWVCCMCPPLATSVSWDTIVVQHTQNPYGLSSVQAVCLTPYHDRIMIR